MNLKKINLSPNFDIIAKIIHFQDYFNRNHPQFCGDFFKPYLRPCYKTYF